jgi:uncharacterized protein with FMN-binding domain
MRRILIALFGTVFGTTLLVGLKYQGVNTPLGAVAGAPADPGAVATDPGQQPGPGQTAKPGSTPGVRPTPGMTPAPGQSTTPAPGQTTTHPGGSTTTTTSAPPPSVTVTGAFVAVQTAQSPTAKGSPCGDCHNYSMAVTITVSNGRIISASASYNTSPGESSYYYSKANSALSPKVLTAQAWSLGRVSGATYSGNAYELSLKDAMSKAGLPT